MRRPPLPEDIPADLSTLIRIGTVVAVDLPAARCRVRYSDPDDEDGEAETPPIRWLTPRAGETRSWSPPSVGEQVVILSPDGQIGAAVALPAIVQDAFPPADSTLREVIVFRDGAEISYDPGTHSLEASLPAGATAEIAASGGIVLRGDVTIEGDVAVTGRIDATEDIVGDGVSLMEHLHSAVQAGTGKSGPPD